MKCIRPLLLTLMVVAFAAGAAANNIDFKATWADPPVTTTAGIYNLLQVQTLYTGIMLDGPLGCPSGAALGLPATFNLTACVGFFNETGQSLSDFEIQFTVPTGSGIIGQSIDCSTSGSLFPAANCSSYTNLQAGDLVMLDFTGGNIPSAPPLNGSLFYLALDGASPSDFPSGGLSGTVNSPEPGTLFLIPSGLALLGLVELRRNRASGHVV